jgi:probable F420-dependent oxidoreductase
MRIGLAAIGIGRGARPVTLRAAASAAEAAGFATLWMGEHVVLFDRHDSRYPYAEDGTFSLPATVDWLDPFVALSFAASVTRSIRLATGICLVPEHNPLILAKQVASLDRLSGGRFALGMGVGWMAEEFAALGVPFERRAQRAREYVEVMRRLWREQATSFSGEFVRLESACSHPKPAQPGGVPVIVGGESHAALARASAYGDGWYGFNLGPDEAGEKIAALRGLLAKRARDPATFEIVVAPFSKPVTPADARRYAALGVHELVIVATPPADEAQVAAWVAGLGREWVGRAAGGWGST